MSTSIIREVPGHETEVGMGVITSTPPHFVITWGEYADQGEADGEIRVIAAVDEDGNDITEAVANVVARTINDALGTGEI